MTAYTPNLPALIGALPDPGSKSGAGHRAPQTEFTRERQVRFLENLSLTGSARSAASAAGVSHQTAYRARRSQAEFRTAWDAALLAARVHAEDVLACRAIDGVEEKVFYHGEEIATRTRYSDRLLLAHLARLDRLTGDARVNAVAEDFDAALARFAAGEAMLAEARSPGPEAGSPPPENLSPGPCNTRSKCRACGKDDCADETDESDDGVDWHDEDAAEAELARIEAAMEADRPADAPRLTGTGPDGEALDPDGLIAEAQWEAFVAGVPDWWLVVPPMPEPVPEPGPEEGEGEERRCADAEELAGAEDEDDAEDCNEDYGEDEGGWGQEDEDGENEGEPSDDLRDEAPPAPAPPPARQVVTGPRRPFTGRPIDDGRCQPFFGRPWDW